MTAHTAAVVGVRVLSNGGERATPRSIGDVEEVQLTATADHRRHRRTGGSAVRAPTTAALRLHRCAATLHRRPIVSRRRRTVPVESGGHRARRRGTFPGGRRAEHRPARRAAVGAPRVRRRGLGGAAWSGRQSTHRRKRLTTKNRRTLHSSQGITTAVSLQDRR